MAIQLSVQRGEYDAFWWCGSEAGLYWRTDPPDTINCLLTCVQVYTKQKINRSWWRRAKLRFDWNPRVKYLQSPFMYMLSKLTKLHFPLYVSCSYIFKLWYYSLQYFWRLLKPSTFDIGCKCYFGYIERCVVFGNAISIELRAKKRKITQPDRADTNKVDIKTCRLSINSIHNLILFWLRISPTFPHSVFLEGTKTESNFESKKPRNAFWW